MLKLLRVFVSVGIGIEREREREMEIEYFLVFHLLNMNH